MRAHTSPSQAASPVPADEGTELPPEDGLAQWTLAVKLQDAPQPVEQATEWALL